MHHPARSTRHRARRFAPPDLWPMLAELRDAASRPMRPSRSARCPRRTQRWHRRAQPAGPWRGRASGGGVRHPGETLTLRHDMLDRAAAMPGLLASVRAGPGASRARRCGLEAVGSAWTGRSGQPIARRMSAVVSGGHGTRRRGTALAAPGQLRPRRRRPVAHRGQRLTAGEGLDGDQGTEQGDRDEVGDTTYERPVQHPVRNRQPGELEQVAAMPPSRTPQARSGRTSAGRRRSGRSAASTATPAAAMIGSPGRVPGTNASASAPASTDVTRVRTSSAEATAARGTPPAPPHRARSRVGRRSPARQGSDERRQVPQHEDRQSRGEEADPGIG